MKNNTNKKSILTALAVTLIFILCMFCSCGSSSSEDATTESSAEKATVTAEEAAKEAKEDAAQATKTGTEDPALDAVMAAATEDIEGFDGSWENLEMAVDDPIVTIDFDWHGSHYQYKYNEDTNKIEK